MRSANQVSATAELSRLRLPKAEKPPGSPSGIVPARLELCARGARMFLLSQESADCKPVNRSMRWESAEHGAISVRRACCAPSPAGSTASHTTWNPQLRAPRSRHSQCCEQASPRPLPGRRNSRFRVAQGRDFTTDISPRARPTVPHDKTTKNGHRRVTHHGQCGFLYLGWMEEGRCPGHSADQHQDIGMKDSGPRLRKVPFLGKPPDLDCVCQ